MLTSNPSSTPTSTLIEEMGAWLRTFAWNWYFTGTFAKPVSTNGVRFVLGEYVQALERVSRTNVNMFWTVERGTTGGNLHAHGLIGNVGTITAFCGSRLGFCVPACGVHLWHPGKAKVGLFDPEGAAPFYICKDAFPRMGEFDAIAKGEWGFIGTPVPIKSKLEAS